MIPDFEISKTTIIPLETGIRRSMYIYSDIIFR
jgi:hypothetical protein